MVVRISQKSAILIERARHCGYADEALASIIANEDVAGLARAEDEAYQYDDFFSYAKEYGDDLMLAVTSGYQIKFNTINGLKIWLVNKIGIKADLDYNVGDSRLVNVPLTSEQLAIVRATIASNWKVIDHETSYEIVLAAVWQEEQ